MNIFTLLTPVIYWILIVLWAFILAFYIKKLKTDSLKGQLLSVLLVILAIDAFRTLFESLYFGVCYTAFAGFLPKSVYTFLIRPEMVFIPKIINIIAAVIVIVILIYRRLPQEKMEIDNLQKIIEKNQSALTKQNESLVREIIARKLVEKEIKKNAENLNTIFNSTPNLLLLVNKEGCVEMINHKGATFLGREKKELLGLLGGQVFNCLNSFDGEGCGKNIECTKCPIKTRRQSTFETGESFEEEGQMTFWLNNKETSLDLLISTDLLNLNGDDKVLLSLTDITERNQAELKLKQSKKALCLSLDVAKAGAWTWDVLTGNVVWDDKMQKIFGIEPGTFDGTPDAWKERVHPDDLQDAEQATLDALEHNGGYNYNYRIKSVTGDWRTVNTQAATLRNEVGKPIRMYGFATDITDQKQAEENLFKNQYYLTKAQEIGKIGTWKLDIQKNRLIWTDENYKIFGVPLRTKLTYEIFLNCIHPEDRDYVHKKWSSALKNEPYDIMHRLIVDNRVKWVREKADISFDAEGKPIIAVGFTQDLTDLKKIEDALKESERKFKTMFEQAPLSYQSLGEDGTFTEVNQTWLQTMGYEREEVLGRNFSDFLIPEWKNHFEENFPRFKAVGEVLGVEFEMVKKDGSVILVSFHGKIGKNPDGSFKQTHCIFNDVTEQRRLEEEKEAMGQKMTQMQKIESIGGLAGGIAHDFNNLLFPIVGMSEMLMEDLPESSQEYENAKEILRAGKRGSELVKQILSFSRQHEHELIPVQIERILREVIKLSRSTIPTNIRIKQNIQQDCGFVMADPIQMHQVMINLMTNAFHAVEEKNGIIDIELREIDLNDEKVPGSLLLLGRYIKFAISDNGIGMAQDVTNKIFEPYFTTKAKGKGTGLGLAVVCGIVKEHKGDIKVYSEVGKGSTFSIYLPLMEKKTEAVSVEQTSKLETGTERILLVDDEEPIIRLESEMLKRLGYKVTEHSNSENAFNTFKTAPEEYDLVITDMNMPNMPGDKLAKEILLIKPDTPIIICTGFSERINQKQTENIGVKGFLMKPVVKSEMAQMVRKVLGE